MSWSAEGRVAMSESCRGTKKNSMLSVWSKTERWPIWYPSRSSATINHNQVFNGVGVVKNRSAEMFFTSRFFVTADRIIILLKTAYPRYNPAMVNPVIAHFRRFGLFRRNTNAMAGTKTLIVKNGSNTNRILKE